MSALANRQFMDRTFLLKFIEKYRELPALWQMGNEEYANRYKRYEAWTELLKFTEEKIPDVDLAFIRKKVENMRSSFRKELRRVRKSQQNGAEPDRVYKPTLWYYEHLKFTSNEEIRPHLRVHKKERHIESTDDDCDDLDDQSSPTGTPTPSLGPQDEVKDEFTDNDIEYDAPGITYHNLRREKRKALDEYTENEYDAIGVTYAAKLKRMCPYQRDIADKLICDILFKGLKEQLSMSTIISDKSTSS